MIKSINIEQYRKLKRINIQFEKGVNAISGTNGTCKTSLLHLFSNSFQAVTKKCEWVKDDNCLKVLNAVNAPDPTTCRDRMRKLPRRFAPIAGVEPANRFGRQSAPELPRSTA